MPKGRQVEDLVGKEFGSLIVIGRAENTRSGKPRSVCVCICGKELVITSAHLRSGKTKTCGHAPVYCAQGHIRSEENLYPDGSCKLCQKERRSSVEYKAKVSKEGKEYYDSTKVKYRKQARDRAAALKLEVLTYYSPGHVLSCCWENCTISDLDMLSLDHVNNDGAEHRRNVGENKTGEKMYRLVKDEGFPEGFQTLCMNHQTKKKLLNVRSKLL